MASWKKYFSAVPSQTRLVKQFERNSRQQTNPSYGSGSKYSSYLPEVYSGAPNRVERYVQYEQMDLDTEISKGLDIISDYSAQNYGKDDEVFNIIYKEEMTETEIKLLKKLLTQWCSTNKWQQRLWRMFRNVIKYGDQIFIRDPETFKLIWIEPTKVEKIIVNENKGKEIEQYVMRDIDFNLSTLVGSNMLVHDQYSFPGGYPRSSNPAAGAGTVNYGVATSPGSRTSRFDNAQNMTAVDAIHVVHLSLSEGMDSQWPFGTSLLESIYKVWKQKDLLEDSIIIYRIVRAPERRVFYIDTGSLSGPRAQAVVERMKNEIYQRRIPNRSGGGHCLDLDIKIPLLDGRTLPLKELITEHESGKQNWVYSCNPETGNFVPGKITWAGITRKNTQVVKITLDNDETIVCTPDHKFPIVNGKDIEAQHLKAGQSLIPANFRLKDISNSNNRNRFYRQIWDIESKKWVWVHRMVGEFFRKNNLHEEITYLAENSNKSKTVIHHKDYNRYNNNPDNLAYMNKEDHIKYHTAKENHMWYRMSDEERENYRRIRSIKTLENHAKMSPEKKLNRSKKQSESQKKKNERFFSDETRANDYKEKTSKARKQYLKDHPEMMAVCLKNLENRVSIKNQELTLTSEMLGIVVDIVKYQTKNKIKALEICDNNATLLELVKIHNPIQQHHKVGIDYNKWGYSKMDRILCQFGYRNWKDFVKKVEYYNHKVVSVEWLEEKMDTGTITVDGEEIHHNYHNFVINQGVVVKNSIVDAAYSPIAITEDFFLSTNAEGNGTKIETLAGGENLGQIDDLRYFNNKLIRGLGIPSSYLPTGPDDGTTPFTDGKVGTAYIQEYRFSKFCQRIQNLLSPVIDAEFKLYVKNKGVEIESSDFEVQFWEPENFSKYKQMAIDSEQIAVFTSLMSTDAAKYISKRKALKKYLGWDEADILENEMLFKQENAKKVKDKIGVGVGAGDGAGGAPGLRSVGVSPTDALGGEEGGEELPGEEGGEEGGTAPTTGGEVPPPTTPTTGPGNPGA